MTAAECAAYEAGRTALNRGLANKAPCYDPIMMKLVTNATSEKGRERNEKILKVWYKGAGREIPKE